MALVLTDAQLDRMARSASWTFDVDFHDRSDSVVFYGDGVDDLNSLLVAVQGNIKTPKIVCDVGSLFSSYKIVTVEDIQALKDKYISIWGTVSKPPYWERSSKIGVGEE